MRQDSIIENLRWVLDSPSLLLSSPSSCAQYLLSSNIQTTEPFSFDYLHSRYSDTDIQHQFEILRSQHNDHRLGAFVENIVTLAIELHPELTLLCWRYPLDLDSGRRLGELDLLLFNEHTESVEHWEIACKFYLQLNDGMRAHDWIGANRNDRLDNKLNHIYQKQMPVLFNAQIEPMIRQLITPYLSKNQQQQPLTHVVQQRLFLKGKLYCNQKTPCLQFPEHINHANSEHCLWYHQSDFAAQMKLSEWGQIDKPLWPGSTNLAQQYGRPLEDHLHYPLLCQHKHSDLQCFVVPDDWSTHA